MSNTDNNSLELLTITTEHFQKLEQLKKHGKLTFIDYYTKPQNVTSEMLIQELSSFDMTYNIENNNIDTDYCWKLYVYINNIDNHNNSRFRDYGISFLPNYVPLTIPFEEQQLTTENIVDNNISKRMSKTVKINYENPPIGRKTPVVSNRISKTSKNNRSLQRKKWGTMFKRNNSRKNDTIESQGLYEKKNWSMSKMFKKGESNKRITKQPYTKKVSKPRGRLWGMFGGSEYETLRDDYINTLDVSVTERELSNKTIIYNISPNYLPQWRYSRGVLSFSTLIKVKFIDGTVPVYLYGSSLPLPNNNGFNYHLGEGQFSSNLLQFYRYFMNINRLISLHGCDLDWSFLPFGHQPSYCKDIDEEKIWTDLQRVNDERRQYYELHWIDMHAGYFNTYESLVKMDYTNPSNKSLIHCLAGFGRTGTSLLLIICKYFYNLEINKQQYYSHFNNVQVTDSSQLQISLTKSKEIFVRLKNLLLMHIETNNIDNTSLDGENIHNFILRKINNRVNEFDSTSIVREMFDNFYYVSQTHVIFIFSQLNLLITRMNYVLYFTALVNNIPNFTLYHLFTLEDFNDLNAHSYNISPDDASSYIFIFPNNIELSQFNSEITSFYNTPQQNIQPVYDINRFGIVPPTTPPPLVTTNLSIQQPSVKTNPRTSLGSRETIQKTIPVSNNTQPTTTPGTLQRISRGNSYRLVHEEPEMTPDTPDENNLERPSIEKQKSPITTRFKQKNPDLQSISFG